MGYDNYVPIKKISIRYKYFCFIDAKEYLADELFIKHKIRVWFQKEAQKPDSDFVFIFCKVKKRDTNSFLKSLEELKRKMILLGYSYYEFFCEDFFKKFLAEKAKAC